MEPLSEWLDAEPGGAVLFDRLEVLDWGNTIRLTGAYRLRDNTEFPFLLTFVQCRDIKWRVYAAFQEAKDRVQLGEARWGRGEHRSPAHLLTERFGLSLTYGQLLVERL